MECTPSEFVHESQGLRVIRDSLPDGDPYYAFSNFTFLDTQRRPNEVDLLLIAPSGVHLVELKGWSGRITGRQSEWTIRNRPGGAPDLDVVNPFVLADKKAKRLRSVLESARRRRRRRRPVPWIGAAVFLHAPGARSELEESAAGHVYGLDENIQTSGLPGVVSHLLLADPADPDRLISRDVAEELRHLLEVERIARRRAWTVDAYELAGRLDDGPFWVDYAARNTADPSLVRILRLYPLPADTSEDRATGMRDAARRELRLAGRLNHPGIVRPLDIVDSDLGPALVLDAHPADTSLDRYIRRHGSRLTVDERLGLVRQLAEAVLFAHRNDVQHRALSPQAILVREAHDTHDPRLRISDWQAALRAAVEGEDASTPTRLPSKVFADRPESGAYLAPEALIVDKPDGIGLDVFAVGALTTFILTGRHPAADYEAVFDQVQEKGGLDVVSLVDDIDIAMLVHDATRGDLAERIPDLVTFLRRLDEAVAQDTDHPSHPTQVNPLQAAPEDVLDGVFVVERRLGQGSTAVALLVHAVNATVADQAGDDTGLTLTGEHTAPIPGLQSNLPERFVLKVATTEDQADRLRREARVMASLRERRVAGLLSQGTLTVGSRTAIAVEYAGPETLAQLIRREGRLQPDLLERFGEDLLEVAEFLYGEGVFHRDIKPDNIGVRERPRDRRKHLALFDFSLATESPGNVRVGTPAYVDPFLGSTTRPRYDSAAERYAAAVTLHEMATGARPRWGDGRTAPGLLPSNAEAKLDAERMDPGLRDGLLSFFGKALARDVRDRFGTAGDMLQAWRAVFRGSSIGADTPAEAQRRAERAADATPQTPLAASGLTDRAVAVLERHGMATVADLLAMPALELGALPGVAEATRREIRTQVAQWRRRFGEVHAGTAATPSAPRSIDAVIRRLLPAGQVSPEGRAARTLLGLAQYGSTKLPPPQPTEAQIADHAGLPADEVGEVVDRVVDRWRKLGDMHGLRTELTDVVHAAGGVVALDEVGGRLVALRGSVANEPLRSAQAAGLGYAAVVTELAMAEPRLVMVRSGSQMALVAALPDGVVRDAAEQAALDLTVYARALGQEAAAIGSLDPLLGPARVLERLQTVPLPERATPLDEQRIVGLAAAACPTVDVSARLELYPRDLPLDRALRTVAPTLQATLARRGRLLDTDVERVLYNRFPRLTARLPQRPALDVTLRESGLEIVWRGDHFASEHRTVTSSGSTYQTRISRPLTPAVQTLEARLQWSLQTKGWLTLAAALDDTDWVARKLVERYGVTEVNLTRVLVETMRRIAAERRVDWKVVVTADIPGGPGRRNLERLAALAAPAVTEAVKAHHEPVLLLDAAPLARYGLLDLLVQMTEDRSRPAARWLLVPWRHSDLGPSLDGTPVPTGGTGFVPIPRDWPSNRPVEVA